MKGPEKDFTPPRNDAIDWEAYEKWETSLTEEQKEAMLDGGYPEGTPEWIIIIHLNATTDEKLLGPIFGEEFDLKLSELEGRDLQDMLKALSPRPPIAVGKDRESRTKNILDNLDPIQRTVLCALYALDGMRAMSHEEVARHLGISIDEVEAHEKEAFRILRHS